MNSNSKKIIKVILINTPDTLGPILKREIPEILIHSMDDLPSMIEKAQYITTHKEHVDSLYRGGAKEVFVLHDKSSHGFHKLIEELKKLLSPPPTLLTYFPTHDFEYLNELEKCLKYGRNSHLSLLLTGESGSGKTHLARALHQCLRPDKPFIGINLLEINPNLIESELFGHVKGSFTGASDNKKGLLDQVCGGTLFLDEIGALPLEIQSKLLKVIEEKTFSPVGSHQFKKVEFSLISATCQDLKALIQEQKFREDFYYRLSGHTTSLKPLRERGKDIFMLLESFQRNYSRRLFFTDEFKEQALSYEWPGNIRELAQLYHKLQCEQSPIVHELTSLKSFSQDKEERKSLPEAIEKLERELFKKEYDRFKGRPNKVCHSLKISKSVFYRLQDSIINSTELSVV